MASSDDHPAICPRVSVFESDNHSTPQSTTLFHHSDDVDGQGGSVLDCWSGERKDLAKQQLFSPGRPKPVIIGHKCLNWNPLFHGQPCNYNFMLCLHCWFSGCHPLPVPGSRSSHLCCGEWIKARRGSKRKATLQTASIQGTTGGWVKHKIIRFQLPGIVYNVYRHLGMASQSFSESATAAVIGDINIMEPPLTPPLVF